MWNSSYDVSCLSYNHQLTHSLQFVAHYGLYAQFFKGSVM